MTQRLDRNEAKRMYQENPIISEDDRLKEWEENFFGASNSVLFQFESEVHEHNMAVESKIESPTKRYRLRDHLPSTDIPEPSNVIDITTDDEDICGHSIEEENEVVVTEVKSQLAVVRVVLENRILRYEMKKTDNFERIHHEVCKETGLPENRLKLFYNDDVIGTYRTFESLQADSDFIFMEIWLAPEKFATKNKSGTKDNGINLKFQTDSVRTTIVMRVQKADTFGAIKKQYADKQHKCVDRLRFHFDGEPVKDDDSPNKLDLEDDDCIDAFYDDDS